MKYTEIMEMENNDIESVLSETDNLKDTLGDINENNENCLYTLQEVKIISTKYDKIFIEINDTDYNTNETLRRICKNTTYRNKVYHNLSVKISNDKQCKENNTIPKRQIMKNEIYKVVLETYNYTYDDENKIGVNGFFIRKIKDFVYSNDKLRETLQREIMI